MAVQRPDLIRPGEFGLVVAADTRRGVFDYHNEALLAKDAPVAAVFIGDSITDMWALDVFFQSASGFIVNRGIGGDRTPYVRRRFEADVLQLHARLAVIMIGVNNTWDLDIWWDPRLLRTAEEIEDEILADTEAMVSAARTEDITVALCSILPTDVPFNGNAPVRNALITRTNARLRTVAGRHGAVYVDYHRHLAAEDGLTLRPGLADDGLHPHVVGYEIMAGVLLDTLTEAGIDILTPRRTM
jgi:lysophospholipase L1-like esterase